MILHLPPSRPWYVKTATPEGKDVVVVIDASGSMAETATDKKSRMDVASDAAATVIRSLNPDDRVSTLQHQAVRRRMTRVCRLIFFALS